MKGPLLIVGFLAGVIIGATVAGTMIVQGASEVLSAAVGVFIVVVALFATAILIE